MDEATFIESSQDPVGQPPAKKLRLAPPSDTSAAKRSIDLTDDQPPAKKFRLAPPSSPMDPASSEQPLQQHAHDPVTEKIPADLMLQARQNFASHHGKELDEVKIDEVIMSEKGIVHWVVVNTPLLAQSAESQVCLRALEKRPIEKTMYGKLDAEVKRRFREEWYATGRTWAFVSLKRFKTHTLSNKNTDKGTYCNWVQLCNKFGGFEHAESRDDARVYATTMQNHGYPYCMQHPVTKKMNWLFVEKLLECEAKEDLQGVRVGNNARSLDWQLR